MPTACTRTSHRLPLWLKVAYTAFVAVLVPVYLVDYGPTNFLYFCDVALLMTVVTVWRECSVLASAGLVGIFLVQMIWVADFLSILVGHPWINMTAYMFDPNIPFFTRFLSFFHFWLPFFLLGLVWRLGYDRRGFWLWTGLALVDLCVCYFLMPAPPPPADNPNLPVNINYVYGFSDTAAQTWIANPNVYFALVLIALPVGILLPSHLLFGWLLRRPGATFAGGKTLPIIHEPVDAPSASPR